MERPAALALVWFFVLGGLGMFFPFYGLYLRENAGLSGVQVGLVLATLPTVGMLAQPFWGQVADRSGSRTRVLALLGLGAGTGYAALALPQSFPALLLVTAGLALFSTALIPSCFAVTLALTGTASPRAFGLVRVWGTVGFGVTVLGFPALLHAHQRATGLASQRSAGLSEPGLELMFPLAGLAVALAGLLALRLPRGGEVALRAERGDWRRLLSHPPYLRLLLFTLLAYLFLQGPMVLFPVYVRSLGGNIDTVSQMWLLMLLPEIPLIAFAGDTLTRFGARGVLAIGVLAGGVRWAVCGLAPDLAWVWPVQALHGVVVAGLVVGAPLYVEQAVPERLRSTGQGVLAMLGVSLGSISSNASAGWLLEHRGEAAPYLVGGVGALLLGAALPWLLPRPRRPQESSTRS